MVGCPKAIPLVRKDPVFDHLHPCSHKNVLNDITRSGSLFDCPNMPVTAKSSVIAKSKIRCREKPFIRIWPDR